MAYRIEKDDAGVQAGLRRIANEQIIRTLGEIDDGELDFAEKIHRVRKRCKKLRGLIRLVRPAFDDYGDENEAFRDAARLLGDVRDARTLIQTYDAVTAHFDDRTDRRAFAPIRARFTRDARKLYRDPETAERLQTFRRAMESARGRAVTWTLDEEGFDAIAGGVGKTYGRGRKRMHEAWPNRDHGMTAVMHEWRKRVKYHGYHARLLSDIAPRMMLPQVEAADELADLLGEHHDLSVLDARLGEAPDGFGKATDVEAFRALLREREGALAEAAFALGRLTFAERRAALVARWHVYWKARSADTRTPEPLLVAS